MAAEMAAADGDAGPGAAGPEEVPPEFECTICMKLLLDPVTVSCGHTFCRACLEQSLGYRGLCAVCRAPVAAGQGVNVLVRSIIAERYPRALAERREELRAELLAGEREADEARRREAGGAGAGAGANASLLPLLRLGGLEAPCLPHCTAEVELRTDLERGLVEYALRGARRLGVIDGSDAFDDDARPLGVCLEIQDIERPPHQLQQPVRVRLVGKFRFWLVEPPEVHEEGFELGRVEAFFDEALSPADLALSRGEAEPPDADGVEQPLPTPEVARAALELLEHQLVQVGHAGRRVFGGKFGEVPVLRTDGATTSASMERLSFWLLGVILVDLSERRQWLACVDTRARLESCRERLAAAGTRPVLDLPGARSWMNPGQSALSSFALLLAIIAVLVAKAMGLFERGFRGYMNDEGLQDTVMFGQLLR